MQHMCVRCMLCTDLSVLLIDVSMPCDVTEKRNACYEERMWEMEFYQLCQELQEVVSGVTGMVMWGAEAG